MPPAPAPRGFAEVETWVFDLDNTLYPAQHDLWTQLDARMRDYVARLLGITPDEAFLVQKDYYRRYGTSLRGLMIEHGVDPAPFLEHVHQLDLSGLDASPRLAAAIELLPGTKLVYTNGSERHATNVLEKLGLGGHFAAIHDIVAAEFHPKPTEEAYQRFLRAHGVAPARAAMFEDLARNLEVPHRLGMATVLVIPPGERIAADQSWEFEGREAAYVDHVTHDLAGFLEGISAGT
ncbi:pyrimidine 5'-nucleotidase [Aquabacter spiritensis]|uniref:Putative hydrolase of the HAD superfamily n=1 Tax=Aquabacter spiritensis TaxID=933073 RepID=A0A4R3LY75_9HYPH|nr:pyrimidine 5'-nucleotidase [Aquabacter spiritensis]TCT05612.1 putative hydrolase of the HAD superfamily [Aquabacter spiritensis]